MNTSLSDQDAPELIAAPPSESITQATGTTDDRATGTSSSPPPTSTEAVVREESGNAAAAPAATSQSPPPPPSPSPAAAPTRNNDNEATASPPSDQAAQDGDASSTGKSQSSSSAVPAEPSSQEPSSQSGSDDKKDGPLPESTTTPTVASAARVPTPSSRTSTPPLSHAAKKKFSSVSVTKEFLSKAASPVPAPAKLVRPTTVTAPVQTTSKLLSTKLTTVPSSKPSTSPKPPASGTASTSSAPWAKPGIPSNDSSTTPLQHPAPTRGAGLPNVVMGSGQGLGSAARRAWGTVGGGAGEGRRGGPGFSGPSMSRDFPTAKEVADGKRKAMLSAQAIAQAEAAHNQAILADLNVFTHLEPNAHRWDEEDEDDDMIDFGDGRTYSALSHPPESSHDQPVAKSERFGDDFDRSWPPKRDEVRPLARQDQSRVLFNASSNRLEPTHGRGQPSQSQPTRLMFRDNAPPRGATQERALPPHLADSGRMLPPHMASSGAAAASQAAPRNSWRSPPGDRDAPPHISESREHREHRELHRPEPASRVLPTRPPQATSTAPPPASLAQAPQPVAQEVAKPPPAAAPAPAPPAPSTAAAAPPTDEAQAAEMHSAAEKARLRRLAEEAEREAAAERARQKARELAERFGPKPAAPAASAPAPAAPAPAASKPASVPPPPPPGLSKPPQPPPGFAKPTPQVTIASRPKPEHSTPEASAGTLPHPPEQPKGGAADRASSWRRTDPLPEHPEPRLNARRPSQDQGRHADGPREFRRNAARDLPPHPTRDAPPHVQQQRTLLSQEREHEAPRSPNKPKPPPGLEQTRGAVAIADHIAAPYPSKRDANIDTMLARLQAALKETRNSPPPGAKRSPQEPSTADGDKQAPEVQPSQNEIEAETPVTVAAPPSAPVTDGTSTAAPAPPKKVAPPPTLPHLAPEYFDATQAEIPRSPPPAWRLYTVKLPKVSPPNRGMIPRSRLRAAETNRSQPRRGWAMTFDPPLDQFGPPRALADALIPLPIGRRFAKQVETGPIVSISPRKLVMYQRKAKQRPTEPRAPVGDALVFGPSTRPVPESSQTQPSPMEQQGPVRKPGKAARIAVPATQTGESGLASDTVSKPPAVRFMVSSELDGDSLLDEVNKMSLEHIGEAYDKGPAEVVELREKTATPPPPSAPAPRNNPTSPNAPPAGPWAKSALAYPVTSPARDDPQREHLKSVWDQAADTTAPSSSAPASAPSQPETPLYPTLNSPASAPDPASLKPAYTMGQTAFGARGQFGQSYSQFMGSGATSPDGGMGVQYGIMGRGGAASSGANGFQQGLWAPSPSFGNSLTTPGGYGFGGAKTAHEQKTGGAMGAFPKDSASYGNDFRYGANTTQPNAAGAYQGTGNASYNGYPGAQYRNPQSVYGHVGGYGHTGFGTQMAGPRANPGASRFPSMSSGGVDYQGVAYDPSTNYYSSGAQTYGPAGFGGGVNGGGSNGMEQGPPRGGGVARKMW